MPFEIPENLHPNLHKFAWLLGRWEGSGEGDYPTIEPFRFTWEVLFQQDGRPFMHYMAQATVVDAEGNKIRNGAQETGFLRPQEDRSLEVMMTHNTGFVEVWHGELYAEQSRFEIVTDAIARTGTAKDYSAGKRLYGYVEGDLLYAYDMAAMGQELQPHLWARLQRQ